MYGFILVGEVLEDGTVGCTVDVFVLGGSLVVVLVLSNRVVDGNVTFGG